MTDSHRWLQGLLVFGFLAGSQLCIASDWTTYLGNNKRDGATDSKLAADLNLQWVYRSQAKPEQAWSGPRTTPIEGHVMLHRVDFDAAPQMLIVKDRVYFGSTVDHKMHCLDATSGDTVWDFYTDGPIRLAPTFCDGKILFGSDDGKVYCLNAENGEPIWDYRVGPNDDRLLARGEMISRWPVRTGVLIDGDTAYFGAGVFPHETVYLCAAKVEDGEIVWKNDRISQQDAGRNDLSPQGYLLANEDFLYVPSGRSLPVAVSRKTGEIVFQRKYSWRSTAGGVVGGTKALLGDGQVYAGGPHHFLAMDEKSGEVGEAYIGGRQMVLRGEHAYLLDGSRVFCVDRAEHALASQKKQEWFLRAREVRREKEKLAEAQEKMKEYAGVGIIWETPCELAGTMIATNELLFVGGQGSVVAFDRNSGEKIWQHAVSGKAMGLAVNDTTLTVSTDQGEIYAFSQSDCPEPKEWPAPVTLPFEDRKKQEFFAKSATEILELSNQLTGFALVVGAGEGRLAYELVRQSELNVIVVEPKEEKAQKLRNLFSEAGLHATRLTVVNVPLDAIPFANYFANLIVSEEHLVTGKIPFAPEHVARFVKPCGGHIVLGQPGVVDEQSIVVHSEDSLQVTSEWLARALAASQGETQQVKSWHAMRRGKLPGAGDWTHQYGDPANTSFANDQRIRGGLGVLWYGDPGPSAMINRHEAAGAPLSTNGRMFIQGTDKVMAYDAYNGNFLWERANPGAIRTGVFNNRETHNLAANDDTLFMAINNEVQALDAATGDVKHRYETPKSVDGLARDWAYIAVEGQQLFGTNTVRQELEEKLRRRGLTISSQTEAIFAYGLVDHKLQWTYHGDNILHTTIALGPDHIYFIDSAITPEERQALYTRDKSDLKALTGAAAAKAEKEMKELDARVAVCLDRETGEVLWKKPVDVTDTTNVSAGGGSLTVMYSDGHLLLCGANANGHYWKQFLSGEFETRKLIVLNAVSGEVVWAKNANYMNRPAIINDQVFAEPWAFDLKTGETKKRPHPITGEESDWRFSRPGHHCGVITATPNMMFFRSGFIGYYDLYADSGTQHFSGQRLGCWVNAIPGNGLVMIPEASAGCVCQFSIASTVVLEPQAETKAWGIQSVVGKSTPVESLYINLGAPGDRTDAVQKIWFGYPRPKAVGRLEYVFDIEPQFMEGGGWFSQNPEAMQMGNSQLRWVYASGARGLKQFSVDLLDQQDKPSNYSVKVYLTGMTAEQAQDLNIRFQGTEQESTSKFISDSHLGPCCVREFSSIPVKDQLKFECQNSSGDSLPQIAAIEIIRQ